MTVQPHVAPLLVAFADFTGYTRHASTLEPLNLFMLFSEYTALASAHLASDGGTLVKTIGDALLIVFSEEKAAAGVMSIVRLKEWSEGWMASRGFKTQMWVKVHFGEAAIGSFGADGRLDVYGSTVNTAATLQSRGIALSPQAFRRLGPAERKAFKKHAPPITYIGVDERHG